MIRIRIERSSEDRLITACYVDGHAGYADHGKDIVCAGVSAVTIGTVNAVEALLGLELPYRAESGLLHFTVPSLEGPIRDKVQLLLESMIVMLNSIRESYSSFVSIQEIKTRRR